MPQTKDEKRQGAVERREADIVQYTKEIKEVDKEITKGKHVEHDTQLRGRLAAKIVTAQKHIAATKAKMQRSY